MCVVKCGDPVHAFLNIILDKLVSCYLNVPFLFGFFGFGTFNDPLHSIIIKGYKIFSIKSIFIKCPQTLHCSIRKFIHFTTNYSPKRMELYNHRITVMRRRYAHKFISGLIINKRKALSSPEHGAHSDRMCSWCLYQYLESHGAQIPSSSVRINLVQFGTSLL